MKVKFVNEELKLLYQTSSSKKYKNVPTQIVKKLVRAVDVLSAATVIQDLWSFPSYRFEHLQGNNRYSMRMDRTWRLEMEIECIISRKSGQKIPKIANLQYYKSKANYGTKKKGISRKV